MIHIFPSVLNPVSFIVFGATGDLFARKIIPSLFLLYTQNKLPADFSVICVGRQKHTTISFREYVLEKLQNIHVSSDTKNQETFINYFEYHHGFLDDPMMFKTLGERLMRIDMNYASPAMKSFYLAIPPEFVLNTAQRIAEIIPQHSYRRQIIIEKPFGKNESEARQQNALLQRFFDSDEIYRIDHYLMKPALSPLLETRAQNKIYEALLKKERIQSIDVTLFETLGVETRGMFYDGIGALRDVGQNHLLEMLTLAIMPLSELEKKSVCEARAVFMSTLPRLTENNITHQTYRGQYEGYRNIPGVSRDSETETAFRISFMLTHPSYEGVRVTLQSGKRMKLIQKDIVIHFQNSDIDSLHIEIEPKPRVYTKKQEIINTLVEFIDPEPTIQYSNEYASLFLHAWCKNHTPFLTEKEVEYMWRFIDPITEAWSNGTINLTLYPPDTMISL